MTALLPAARNRPRHVEESLLGPLAPLSAAFTITCRVKCNHLCGRESLDYRQWVDSDRPNLELDANAQRDSLLAMPSHGKVLRVPSRKNPFIDFYPDIKGRGRFLYSLRAGASRMKPRLSWFGTGSTPAHSK